MPETPPGPSHLLRPDLDWSVIRTVFLDMDGTLLDLHFDNQFWLEHVPRRYAEKHGLPLDEAKDQLFKRYRRVEGTMDWYCIDYWSRELGMDIAVLKQEVEHLIAVHPHVITFLDAVRAAGKRSVLVTNAHGKSLALKMKRTALGEHLDSIVCAHDLGIPKEETVFWGKLREVEDYQPNRTLLVDDNLEVLRSAQAYGIKYLLAVERPDTKGPVLEPQGFAALSSFREIIPRP